MAKDIDDIMRETRRYWYEDGLAEILTGSFFVALGLLLLAEWASPADAPWRWLFALALPVLVIGWIPLGRVVINRLKERITYPRTGYVAYRRERRRRAASLAVRAAVVGSVVGLVASAAILNRQDMARLAPLLLGGGVALLLVRINSGLGFLRFTLLAVWSLVVGAVLSWLTADLGLGIGSYYLALGLGIVLGGAITVAAYLRATTPEAGHDD